MEFKDINIGKVFFDPQTLNVYIKKTEKAGWVYILKESCEFRDSDGQPMQVVFPPNYPIAVVLFQQITQLSLTRDK